MIVTKLSTVHCSLNFYKGGEVLYCCWHCNPVSWNEKLIYNSDFFLYSYKIAGVFSSSKSSFNFSWVFCILFRIIWWRIFFFLIWTRRASVDNWNTRMFVCVYGDRSRIGKNRFKITSYQIFVSVHGVCLCISNQARRIS